MYKKPSSLNLNKYNKYVMIIKMIYGIRGIAKEEKEMQIAICDDDRGVCRQLREWIGMYANREGMEVNLMTFYTAEELLESLVENNWFDMIFQDIELPRKSGIDIAKKLRSYVECNQVVIDFISGKQEYGMQLFSLQPINFRLKPLRKEEIMMDLNKACRILQERRHVLTYVTNSVQNGILLKDICYIESKDKMVHVHTVSGKIISIRDTLSRIEREYEKFYFCRCHRAFVINLHYVTAYHKGYVVLCDEIQIDVGEFYVKHLKLKLSEMDYMEGM